MKTLLAELAQTASAPEIEQTGSGLTVRVAGVEAATLQGFVNCARNCLALSLAVVAKV